MLNGPHFNAQGKRVEKEVKLKPLKWTNLSLFKPE